MATTFRTNSLPSLHVAISWLLCFALRGTRRLWAGVVRACAISVSVLTVKRHHVVDVIAGFILAAALTLGADRWRRLRHGQAQR